MPKIITSKKEEQKKNTSTTDAIENALGDLEVLGDVVSFVPGLSAIGSVGSALAGTAKDITKLANGKQSGLTTLSNIGGHALWGLVGIIPGGKALKYIGKGKNILKVGNKSAKAIEATETATKGTKSKFFKDLYKTTAQSSETGAKTLGRFTGRSAVAGTFTYGIPGIEQSIAENDYDYSNGEWIVPTIGIIKNGALNGWNAMTEDVGRLMEGDVGGAGARLGSVFLLPHAYVNRKILPSKAKSNSSSKSKSNSKNISLLERKTTINGPGFTSTTTGKVEKPATKFKKKFGGKLKHLNDLRQ